MRAAGRASAVVSPRFPRAALIQPNLGDSGRSRPLAGPVGGSAGAGATSRAPWRRSCAPRARRAVTRRTRHTQKAYKDDRWPAAVREVEGRPGEPGNGGARRGACPAQHPAPGERESRETSARPPPTAPPKNHTPPPPKDASPSAFIPQRGEPATPPPPNTSGSVPRAHKPARAAPQAGWPGSRWAWAAAKTGPAPARRAADALVSSAAA